MSEKLYPLIGKRVQTPRGAGRLWQVFRDRAAVILDNHSDKVFYCDPADIRVTREDGIWSMT